MKRMSEVKKRVAFMLFSMMFIVACGSPAEEDSEETDEANEQGTEMSEEEDESTIEVDKGILNVEVTLPPSLFEEDEFTEIEEEMKEEGNADVTQNDDGSITIKMSKKDHKKMLKEMKEDFSKTITEIVEDDEFASIQDITYNNDFTELKMIVSREAFENSFDGFATMSLGFGSLFYQAFNGKDLEKEKVHILLEDEATNEVFEEITYPDILDEVAGNENK